MNKQKKAQMKKIIAWVALAILVAVLAVMPLLAESSAQQEGPQASILSDTASLRTVETRIIGGGSLTAADAVEVTIPAEIKLTEYLVKNGDIVSEGDPIATVDRVSVMSAISLVQDTLELLREQIEEAADEENSDSVKALAGGTVKAVYAQAGDDVQTVMMEHGALAVLSLDGRMAVEIQRHTDLAGGDTVCVTFPDDTEVEGRVESNLDGTLIVTVSDDDYAIGETVVVTSEDGDRIGSGQLYVHAPWNAVAYSGAVKAVNVKENDTVYSGRTLFTLTDTGIAAQYQLLVNSHREYEELMLELFQLYQTETLTAPCSGMVTGVDEAGAYMLSSQGSFRITLLANAPSGDDETTYVNYVGIVSQVGIDGLILKLNPQAFAVEDYLDLSGVNLDTSLMTEELIYTVTVPVYAQSDGEWEQLDAASITAGDILLFAGDESGSMVWAVLVGHEEVETDPEEPTQPEEPTVPENPEDPTQPEDTEDPTMPEDEKNTTSGSGNQTPQGSSGGMSGGTSGGFSGGSALEEEESLYGTSTLTVASVIPQEEMTISITVDELDIANVSLGMEVQVTVSALTGETFTGTVTEIGAEGTNEGGSSKFTVTVTLPLSENMLNGMTAVVKLPLEEAQNVLTVPVAAMYEEGSRTYVYTAYDEEEDVFSGAVEVVTGISDGEYVQILSGLSEDDAVFYEYYDTLTVSITPESGGFSFGK